MELIQPNRWIELPDNRFSVIDYNATFIHHFVHKTPSKARSLETESMLFLSQQPQIKFITTPLIFFSRWHQHFLFGAAKPMNRWIQRASNANFLCSKSMEEKKKKTQRYYRADTIDYKVTHCMFKSTSKWNKKNEKKERRKKIIFASRCISTSTTFLLVIHFLLPFVYLLYKCPMLSHWHAVFAWKQLQMHARLHTLRFYVPNKFVMCDMSINNARWRVDKCKNIKKTTSKRNENIIFIRSSTHFCFDSELSECECVCILCFDFGIAEHTSKWVMLCYSQIDVLSVGVLNWHHSHSPDRRARNINAMNNADEIID